MQPNRKKKAISLFISVLLLGGVFMTSCDKNDTVSVESTDVANLALNAPYAYDFGFSVTGDNNLSVLTNGDETDFVELRTNLKKNADTDYTLTFSDWYNNKKTSVLENDTIAVSVDLGFMASVKTLKLLFTEYKKSPIRVFTSSDGYNFTNYLGEFDTYDSDSKTWKTDTDVSCKAIQFVLPSGYGETIKLNEIIINGTQEYKRELLSLGASYTWEGTQKKYTDDGNKKLTDGKTFADSSFDALVAKSSSEADKLTGKTGSVITLDLNAVKNVSEVSFGIFKSDEMSGIISSRINVRYSTDNENWFDFGQSFLRTSNGESNNSSYRFLVTRNHTVEARYIKIYTYIDETLILDEISVYGNNRKVAEPDYNFINRSNQLSNTNIAAYKNISLNGTVQNVLSDMITDTAITGVSGDNEIIIDLGGKYENVCSAAIGTTDATVNSVKVFYKDGSEYKEIETKGFDTTVASLGTKVCFFDNVATDSIKLIVNADKALNINEVYVYASQPQLPLVRGGFFQLPTSGGENPASLNSEYTWYLQLKGMKELGMETVVLQYSTHYKAKTTLINGQNIKKAGYTYNVTYGSADVCTAILNAAEKLGMKVFIGTIHDSNFTDPAAYMTTYEKIVNDSYAVIKDIYEMYSNSSAFGGYYLSDETCDQWLNMQGGITAARVVYKSQSDYIRSLDSDAQIMIAPAIWRSGTEVLGADNLYSLIAPETNGGKPVVDIVAAQDCLGRESTLSVPDSVYEAYEKYAEEWAKAVRRAGAQFWHDTEVFEVISTSKRYEDLIKSLSLQMNVSGSIIVFDIPHYFSTYSMSDYNDEYDYYKRLIMRKYVQYYSSMKAYDLIGTTAVQPEVITDDGKQISENSDSPVVPEKTYNEGVITAGTLTPDNVGLMNWQKFLLGNSSGSVPEFVLTFDKDNFYVAVKNNDSSADFGKGVWWEGKDDLFQIWMVTSGSAAASALENDYGVRYYIQRTAATGWTAGGETASKTKVTNFKFTEKNGVILITMPWSDLGIKAPQVKDGTAMGIKIQYIDGKDGSWASSDSTLDQSIKDTALYSF